VYSKNPKAFTFEYRYFFNNPVFVRKLLDDADASNYAVPDNLDVKHSKI